MNFSATCSALLRAVMRHDCAAGTHAARSLLRLFAVTLALLAVCGDSFAQPPAEGTVQINLQGDVKLEALLNYVSQRLGVKFLYTTDVSDVEVTIHTPSEIPVESLMTLLNSVLRSEYLALVDSELPGWKRIVDVSEMAIYAPTGQAAEILKRDGSAAPVTQVFVLENVDAQPLIKVVEPFLTKDFATIFTVPGSNVVVITDYAVNVKQVANLVGLIDRPPGETTYEFYEVQYQQSSTLTEQVLSILGQAGGDAAQPSAVQLFDEPHGNRIVVVGLKTFVDQAIALLKQLDVSLGMTTHVYRLRNITAERMDNIIGGYLAPQDVSRTYQSTIDEDGNLLVVRTTEEIHRQLQSLVDELDQPLESADSPLQFYKLKNASAIDVLYSLLALQDAYGTGLPYGAGVPYGGYSPFGGMPVYPGGYPGAYAPLGGTASPFLGAGRLGGMATDPGQIPGQSVPTTRLPLTPGENGVDMRPDNLVEDVNPLAAPLSSTMGLQMGGFGGVATLPGGARVSADPSTNSIIVVAPASVQPMYAKLIESLDQRRPQVLIEAKIVAINTTDNYSLGVEVSMGDRSGESRLFKFTSFGLSEVDPVTGALEIIPSLGFNGTLVDPDVADVVVKALAQHTRAKVLAAPKILVNDNSVGKLESITSIPFQSVNASQTVSTTSLGGDQQAGTIITATPHINEDDHLQLQFDVEFSVFQGTGTGILPPPRQIDRVGSTVTIPDGQTIVVGGLKRIGDSHEFAGIPWLENIPIVRELTSRTDDGQTTTSFFLFIRPVILRDSRFRDLKFYSSQSAERAGVSGGFPSSRPLLIR